MRILFISFVFIAFYAVSNGQDGETQSLKVGDTLCGGIVFYVDQSGEHGLIAAPSDQGQVMRWGNKGFVGSSLKGDGSSNTRMIVEFNNARTWLWPSSAACLCDTSTLNGFSDWYLPAIDELEELFHKQKAVGNFTASVYCSSTEYDKNKCLNVRFAPLEKKQTLLYSYKKTKWIYKIRCIRKF